MWSIRTKLKLVVADLRANTKLTTMTKPDFARDLSVFAGPATAQPPFDVDVVVIEQDCDLVLDTEAVIHDPRESIGTLVRAVETAPPTQPGSVIVKGHTKPLQFLAIVHDFSAEPASREEWVASAFDAIFGEMAARGFEAVGLPMLGSVHGKLSVARSFELLEQSLWRNRPACLGSLWLLLHSKTDIERLDHWRDAGCDVTLGQWPQH